MCTYNGEKYLREQLQSIAAQTRLPDELVICDDGSSDATPEIIEEFARSAPFPVRLFRNPQNLGSTKNFEKAIGLCTGDLIALCDQDDIWMPEKLALQAEMMERDPELGGVFSDAELIDAASRPFGKRLWASVPFTLPAQRRFQAGCGMDVLLKGNVVTGATLMVRASLRSRFMPIPPFRVHDGWIALLTAFRSPLRLVEEPLIQYRIHASQQIGIGSAPPLPPTLRGRLEKGKREEPGKHLANARELRELERLLVIRTDLENGTVLPTIRRMIRFHEDRGRPYASRVAHIGCILRNAPAYLRYEYENGWKCLVRDVILVFVYPKEEIDNYGQGN